MNRSDVARIAHQGDSVNQLLEKHGAALFTSTHDWQSPLRSGGAAGCKGDHADPTPSQVITPDPLALAHAEYVQLLKAQDAADAALGAFVHHHKPVNPDAIERGRVNLVPACIVCAGPAVPIRRGMCLTDYRAWLRADRPDLEGFKRMRQREVEAQRAVVHEHEQAS